MVATISASSVTVLSWTWNVGLAILLLLFLILRHRGQVPRRAAKWVIVLIVLLQLVVIIIPYIQTYAEYVRSPIGSKLLPPHDWFLLRKFTQSFVTIFAGWVAAVIVWLIGRWAARRREGLYLDADDFLRLTVATVAIGWPGVLILLAMTFLLAVLHLLILAVARRRTLQDRLIITPSIIPAAVITLIFRLPLLNVTHLQNIRF